MLDTNTKIVRIKDILRHFRISINHQNVKLDQSDFINIGVDDVLNALKKIHVVHRPYVDFSNLNRMITKSITKKIVISTSLLNFDVITRATKDSGERIVGVLDNEGIFILTNILGGGVSDYFVNNTVVATSKRFSNYTDLGNLDGYPIAVKDGIYIEVVGSYDEQDIIDAIDKYKSSGIFSYINQV